MFTSRVVGICVCLMGLAGNPASASELYSYTGNNYEIALGLSPPYDTSMRVTATLELASPLAPNLVDADVIPIRFQFNDGVNTITETSYLEQQVFKFSTDGFGIITLWNVSAQTALPSPSNVGDQKWEIATLNTTFGLQADYGSISTCVIDSSCGIFEVESGQISDNPGKWTVVPVPPALWLFGSGMLGLIVIARRRKRLDGMNSDGGLGGRVLFLRKI